MRRKKKNPNDPPAVGELVLLLDDAVEQLEAAIAEVRSRAQELKELTINAS